jgi:hypothetical protein
VSPGRTVHVELAVARRRCARGDRRPRPRRASCWGSSSAIQSPAHVSRRLQRRSATRELDRAPRVCHWRSLFSSGTQLEPPFVRRSRPGNTSSPPVGPRTRSRVADNAHSGCADRSMGGEKSRRGVPASDVVVACGAAGVSRDEAAHVARSPGVASFSGLHGWPTRARPDRDDRPRTHFPPVALSPLAPAPSSRRRSRAIERTDTARRVRPTTELAESLES